MVAKQVATTPKPQNNNEELLLIRLLNPATKQRAFEELVSTYKERIYLTIRKLVIDHSDTDDLMQEVFLKIWNGLDNFRRDAKLFTWVYRIAVNESLTFLAKKKRRFFFGSLQDELENKLQTQSELQADQVQLLLQKALLRLPEKQRVVFNMRYYDELSYEQISEILGTSVGALKASYHFAVKKIEDYISKSL